jgi:hypothetical protein
MSAIVTKLPSDPRSVVVSVPLPGSVVIFTAAKLVAGLSFGSLKPKSTAVNVVVGVLEVVTVLLVPAGASFTDVTSMSWLRARVEFDAAVGDAAVVAHLEGEARVAAHRWRWRRRELAACPR